MSEWTDVEHREEIQIRVAEEGEVVSTLAGPQHASAGDFVLRRRVIPADVSEMDEEQLRKRYEAHYNTPASDDAEREDLYQSLFPWDVRRCDPEYAEHHFRVEDLDIVEEQEEPEDDEVPYEEWTNDELKAEIVRRNEKQESDSGGVPEGYEPIAVEAPGNKAELVAALEADDARANQE